MPILKLMVVISAKDTRLDCIEAIWRRAHDAETFKDFLQQAQHVPDCHKDVKSAISAQHSGESHELNEERGMSGNVETGLPEP